MRASTPSQVLGVNIYRLLVSFARLAHATGFEAGWQAFVRLLCQLVALSCRSFGILFGRGE